MSKVLRRFIPLPVALLLTVPVTAVGQEFTQQLLLVAPLHPEAAGPTNRRLARQVASTLRNRLSRLLPRREVYIVGNAAIENLLIESGFRPDTVFNELATLSLARQLRADEVVVGRVAIDSGVVEIQAQLRIMRDWRLRQPLPVVRAATPAAAADSLARHVVLARSQMTGLRRCENNARAGRMREAMLEAEAAVLRYPASVLARNCLAILLPFNHIPADSVRNVTARLLALDSLNIVAAVMNAVALTALEQTAAAAQAWQRVLALRPDSLETSLDAVERLLRLRNPAAALEWSQKLGPMHDNDVRFRRLAFRAHVALGAWKEVAALGDSLDAEDAEFRNDSSYAIRHVEGLRLIGDTLGALAKSARVVKQHPGDVGLYLQYLQLITGENTGALARGIAYFPGSSELRVLAARAARSAGRRRDAIAELGAAVASDPELVQGYLQMAELWFEEGNPDSALAAIVRAPREGSAGLLRAYAIARGRQMVGTATDSMPDGWRHAIRLFALADTLGSQDDSRALLAAVSLQLARAEYVAATETRACDDVNRVNGTLALSADALGRGVGNGTGASELTELYGALKAAVDNAVKVLCPP
jgi:tetratricopeptide (TPR) repeat protein